jgi:hypothetical protein
VKKGRRKKAAAVDPKEPKAVDGQLLNARSLERSATHIKNATALRVLMVLAAYANDDGLCWPCQDDIAARLGMLRHHVNRAIALLVSEQCIFAKGERGRRKTYQLNREGLELERAREDDVQIARIVRRQARNAERGEFNRERVKSKPAQPAPALEAGKLVRHASYGRGIVIHVRGGEVTVRWDSVMALPFAERACPTKPHPPSRVAPSSLRVLDERPEPEAYRSAMKYDAMMREDEADEAEAAQPAPPQPAQPGGCEGGEEVELKEVIAKLNRDLGPEPELKVGKFVHHAKHGRGMVHRIDGDKIDVRFQLGGPLYTAQRSYLRVLDQ